MSRSVKTRMEERAGVLEAEIKLDAGRGGTTGEKEKELAETKVGIQKVTSDMASHLAEVNKEIREAAAVNPAIPAGTMENYKPVDVRL